MPINLFKIKTSTQNLSQPTAGLLATSLYAQTGEVVRRSFGELYRERIKLSNSHTVLHWISNQKV